jgi:hypothetical protein
MKTRLNSMNDFRRLACGALGAITLFVLGGLALPAHAQVNSPVGTWDCLMAGGGQKGIAFLDFSIDSESGEYVLQGYELIAESVNTANRSGDGRNLGGGIGRGISDTGTNASTQVNIFGFTPVSGTWSYDDKGRVIGYISFTVEDPIGSSNFVVNAVSFVGKARANKRLNLVASTTFGRVTYHGVPLVPVTGVNGLDFSGTSWYGTKRQSKQDYQEFFTLTASGLMPNIYDLNGQGPGYTYSLGECMISSSKKIGFALFEVTDTNSMLRASVGSFINNRKSVRGNTKGIIEPGTNITFKATMNPPN